MKLILKRTGRKIIQILLPKNCVSFLFIVDFFRGYNNWKFIAGLWAGKDGGEYNAIELFTGIYCRVIKNIA